ncbi:MAG: TIR domain-containing protein [Devosia sp.]
MTDVFISYKHRLKPRVEAIASALSGLGLDVWYDAGLLSGSDYSGEIAKYLRAARCVLVCWSDDAFPHGGDEKGWVRGEAEKGLERDTLVAVTLEPTDLDPPWNMVHYETLTDWAPASENRDAWQRTLAAIGAKVGRPGLGDYDKAQYVGTSEALAQWARQNEGDMLAIIAKARAKELYLIEAEAQFEAKEAARAQSERDASRQAEIHKAERERLHAEAAERARMLGAKQRSGEQRDDVLRVPKGEPKVASTATGPGLLARDIAIFGAAGLVLSAVTLYASGATGYMGNSTLGLVFGVAGTLLYGIAVTLAMRRHAALASWRWIVLAAAFPLVAVGSGAIINVIGPSLFRTSSPGPIIGLIGGVLGGIGMFAVLFALRAIPASGRVIGLAAAVSIGCAAIAGLAGALVPSRYDENLLLSISVAWQLAFTTGLALVASQVPRSASSI